MPTIASNTGYTIVHMVAFKQCACLVSMPANMEEWPGTPRLLNRPNSYQNDIDIHVKYSINKITQNNC